MAAAIRSSRPNVTLSARISLSFAVGPRVHPAGPVARPGGGRVHPDVCGGAYQDAVAPETGGVSAVDHPRPIRHWHFPAVLQGHTLAAQLAVDGGPVRQRPARGRHVMREEAGLELRVVHPVR
jgi:hypothetical protein